MEYAVQRKEIRLDRKLNNLDRFVLDFCNLLENYVIVSGYVSILFGRSRTTEDIDLLVPAESREKFKKLWSKIHNFGFHCINTDNPDKALEMLKEHAIRFSKKRKPIPNIEFKIIKNDADAYSFKNRLRVKLKTGILFISPIEMQIAYKLNLGSNKDLEDAKHLYELFKEKLNKDELFNLVNEFKVRDKFNIIKKEYGTRFRKIG